MIHSYIFAQNITLKNSEIVEIVNVKTLDSLLRLKMKIAYRFLILKQVGAITNS